MALKKQNFAEGEIAIFDEACVYKRGEYWQFRLWLPKENKYARKSLRTRSESTATDDIKRHRTNRLYTYSSTATVTKSTRQQRQTLGNQSKVHGLKLFACMVDTMTDWHSEALCKYFCLITAHNTRRKKTCFLTFPTFPKSI